MARKPAAAPSPELDPELAKLPLAARMRMANLKHAAKKFGDGSIMTGGQLDAGLKFVPDPNILTRVRLRRPGWALGRICSIIGYEGASKTSNMYHKAALFARCGASIDIVTVERAESTQHVIPYLDPDLVTFWRAKSLEEAIKMSFDIQARIREMDPNNEIPHFQGFDSVAAAVFEKMLEEEEVGKKTPGGFGGIMKDFVNTMIQKIEESQTFWCVLNQARDKQAMDRVMQMVMQYQPQIEKMGGPGGRALPFASTYFEVLEKTGRVKDEEKLVQGFSVRSTFKKNKLGQPDGIYEYDIVWGKDFDMTEQTVEVLASGNVCGLQVKDKRYWCPEFGVPETKKLRFREMYEVMSRPENQRKIDVALGVVDGWTFPVIQDVVTKPQASDYDPTTATVEAQAA